MRNEYYVLEMELAEYLATIEADHTRKEQGTEWHDVLNMEDRLENFSGGINQSDNRYDEQRGNTEKIRVRAPAL